jgi:hypothetical protein
VKGQKKVGADAPKQGGGEVLMCMSQTIYTQNYSLNVVHFTFQKVSVSYFILFILISSECAWYGQLYCSGDIIVVSIKAHYYLMLCFTCIAGPILLGIP